MEGHLTPQRFHSKCTTNCLWKVELRINVALCSMKWALVEGKSTIQFQDISLPDTFSYVSLNATSWS